MMGKTILEVLNELLSAKLEGISFRQAKKQYANGSSHLSG